MTNRSRIIDLVDTMIDLLDTTGTGILIFTSAVLAVGIAAVFAVGAGWAFSQAQTPTAAAAPANPATQALNAMLQNAIQQTARATDLQIDLLGIYKSIPPAILAYVQEQQQIAAEKDQWWARQNAGMQQLLDAARAQAAKQ